MTKYIRTLGSKHGQFLLVPTILLVLLAALGLVACSNQEQVVEVTRVVTEVNETEVTRLVEVEVTRVVEVPVQVTRVVEIERIVTSTPLPATPTPRAPEQGFSDNPYPLGSTVQMITGDSLEFDFTVLEVLRGDEAWQRVRAANQFNDAPGPDNEYIMARVAVQFNGPGTGILELNESDIELVSQGRIYDWFSVSDACCLDPSFDFELLPGAYAEGWFAWPIPPDPKAMLKLGSVYFSLSQEPSSSPDTSPQDTENTVQDTGSFDLESFTDSWVFGDEDEFRIFYHFYEDGTYMLETRATLEMQGFQPQTVRSVIEGTWEFQEGITVCLESEDQDSTCFEWHLEDDTLRRGDDPAIFRRVEE